MHLDEVAKLAGEFASAFAASEWAEACGRWHDLGKYSVEFQDKLRLANGYEAHLEGQPGRVDHSTAGAQHAVHALPRLGRLLAYVIAGHHCGLSNSGGEGSSLDARLAKTVPRWSDAPVALLAAPKLGDPPLTFDRADARRIGFQLTGVSED